MEDEAAAVDRVAQAREHAAEVPRRRLVVAPEGREGGLYDARAMMTALERKERGLGPRASKAFDALPATSRLMSTKFWSGRTRSRPLRCQVPMTKPRSRPVRFSVAANL